MSNPNSTSKTAQAADVFPPLIAAVIVGSAAGLLCFFFGFLYFYKKRLERRRKRKHRALIADSQFIIHFPPEDSRSSTVSKTIIPARTKSLEIKRKSVDTTLIAYPETKSLDLERGDVRTLDQETIPNPEDLEFKTITTPIPIFTSTSAGLGKKLSNAFNSFQVFRKSLSVRFSTIDRVVSNPVSFSTLAEETTTQLGDEV